MNNDASKGPNIPAACNGVDPCQDKNCQMAIVKMHQISEQEFQSRIIPEAGAPKQMMAGEIQGIMDGGVCATDGILFNQQVLTNAELNPIAGPYDPSLVCYSIPFFKGIFLESPESFSFYLATGGASGRDVIFSVSYPGMITCFYDCSQSWPFLPK